MLSLHFNVGCTVIKQLLFVCEKTFQAHKESLHDFTNKIYYNIQTHFYMSTVFGKDYLHVYRFQVPLTSSSLDYGDS